MNATHETYKSKIHRCTLGEAVVTTIQDGTHIRKPINPPFALDKTDDEIAHIAARNNLPAYGFESGYTPTIIRIG
jgi:hypothetical protein